MCQKRVSKAGKSNCIPQILWAVITCPFPWYLFPPHKSSYMYVMFPFPRPWASLLTTNQNDVMTLKGHVSRTGWVYYIPQIVWNVITCPFPWCVLPAHKSLYVMCPFSLLCAALLASIYNDVMIWKCSRFPSQEFSVVELFFPGQALEQAVKLPVICASLTLIWVFVQQFRLAYEVRDLFPWEMFTKMGISCLLNVEKIWNSAQINLSLTLNFYRRYVFDATISTEKSTSEIDADLAQNDM